MENKPIHIGKKEIPKPVISQRESELEEYAERLQEENKKLNELNYINNLADDKVFRAEVLGSLNSIAVSINNFLSKIEASQGDPKQE